MGYLSDGKTASVLAGAVFQTQSQIADHPEDSFPRRYFQGLSDDTRYRVAFARGLAGEPERVTSADDARRIALAFHAGQALAERLKRSARRIDDIKRRLGVS